MAQKIESVSVDSITKEEFEKRFDQLEIASQTYKHVSPSYRKITHLMDEQGQISFNHPDYIDFWNQKEFKPLFRDRTYTMILPLVGYKGQNAEKFAGFLDSQVYNPSMDNIIEGMRKKEVDIENNTLKLYNLESLHFGHEYITHKIDQGNSERIAIYQNFGDYELVDENIRSKNMLLFINLKERTTKFLATALLGKH